MRSLQAALQSRVSKRSAEITGLLLHIKMFRDSNRANETIERLRELEDCQKLDKKLLRQRYWG